MTYQLRKSLFLYNENRVEAPADDLILIEGFPSVWWLHQHGFANVVAMMGASLSEEQAAAVVDLTAPDSRVWILTDGDDAGRRCAGEVLSRIAPQRFCRWLQLPDGKQPTDLEPDELRKMFDME